MTAAKPVALAKLVADARRTRLRRGGFVAGAAAAAGKPMPLARMMSLAARALGSRGSR